MHNLVIIGGGFAGFWSAMSAVREARTLGKTGELKITLLSKNAYHTIKPRLYEQNRDDIQVPLQDYCEPLNIKLIVGEVIEIDPKKSNIVLANHSDSIMYDTLIFAAGSQLQKTKIPGLDKTFNVDTVNAASDLDAHLRKLSKSEFTTEASKNIVVVGGGSTGIEVITMMPQRLKELTKTNINFKIHLINKSPQLASSYSKEGQQYINDRLNRYSIEQHLNTEVSLINDSWIELNDGKRIETETVIWTVGVEASPLTNNFDAVKDEIGRLYVDKFLRLPKYNNVFVAGDTAKVLVDEKNHALMSCQHAMPQGKFAGHNAVNAIFNNSMKSYAQPKYLACLNLGPEDALFTSGWERKVQMTGTEANALKTQINTMWIYPMADVEKTIEMSLPVVEAVE